jgi:hypothetical protein
MSKIDNNNSLNLTNKIDNNKITQVPLPVLYSPNLKIHFGVDGKNKIASESILNFKYSDSRKEILEYVIKDLTILNIISFY